MTRGLWLFVEPGGRPGLAQAPTIPIIADQPPWQSVLRHLLAMLTHRGVQMARIMGNIRGGLDDRPDGHPISAMVSHDSLPAEGAAGSCAFTDAPTSATGDETSTNPWPHICPIWALPVLDALPRVTAHTRR